MGKKLKSLSDRSRNGQECETVALLLIYSKTLFDQIIDQYGAVILL